MDFRFREEEEQFRQEVKEFIKEELTPEAHTVWAGEGLPDTPPRREFLKRLARKGWLGLSWPKEYGGQGLPGIYEYILSNELAYASAPHAGRNVSVIGKTLIRHGNERLKSEFLPRIARDEIQIALGYTEPEAGSDLASLQTRAVPDGDDYLINGQKRFSTSSHYSEYIWLATRTNPNVDKHNGISLFIVDLTCAGVTIEPLWTMSGNRTNEVFFDNVRVPRYRMVGELNKGWYYIREALALERFALTAYAPVDWRKFETLLNWVKEAERQGKLLAKDPLVRQKMARLAIEVEILKLIEYQVISRASKGLIPHIEAAMCKLFGTELLQRLNRTALEIMGLYGELQEGSRYVPLEGKYEQDYRDSVRATIGAGSSEMQRNIIGRSLMGSH